MSSGFHIKKACTASHSRSCIHIRPADYIIFAAVMLAVFELTFNTLGRYLSDLLSEVLQFLTLQLALLLSSFDINPAFYDLVINGICPGVGSVLSFIPVIAVLFFLLGLLQETGYLSKASILMDRPLKHAGLAGSCIIPLIMGFGCAVPAIMYTASMNTVPHRSLISTIRLIPFMSCSARLPVYSMLISCFFPEHRITVLLSIYATGILTAAAAAFVLRIFPSSEPCSGRLAAAYTPEYHMPDMSRVISLVCENILGFVKKAFTVIFTASVLIWFLQSYSFDIQPVSSGDDSMLASMGRICAPIFAPLGFGSWKATAAVISGLFAKEAIISTLVVTSSSAASAGIPPMMTLSEIFDPLSAFSFMIFCLLYMPCIATLSAVRSVTGSWRESIIMAVLHLIIAWSIAFIVYNVGTFIISLI